MSSDECPASTSDGGVDNAAEELKSSALRDNISKKGKNAYYYAHAHKADGPKWDGKIEPRLLSTSSSNLSSTTSTGVPDTLSSSCKATLMAKSNITNYAFLNEETKVKIYVNLPGVGDCVDENITLDYTEQSLSLTIKNYMSPSAKVKEEVDELLVVDTAPPAAEEEEEETKKGEDRCLAFGKLYGSIEKATFKKKVDKVIITLKKKDDKVWNAVCA